MCGIAGILHTQPALSPLLPAINKMTKAMAPRGPDDEGYVWFESTGDPKVAFGDATPTSVKNQLSAAVHIQDRLHHPVSVVLGHRRLSIIDLSAGGHQPMTDDEERFWITYNGEIYNFQEIRTELVSLGHRFRTQSDTEVILKSFIQWQEKCLSRFNGDFAFGIWDRATYRLFLARDRLGVKPLYYHYNGNHFIFASDIKTIIASELYAPKPNKHGVYLAMAYGIAPRPMTAFEGVQAVPQAHWMTVEKSGQMSIERYWNIPIGQAEPMSEADAIEGLEHHLTAAIKRRLIADVPVGTFMSGGIDSTTMSAIAAQLNPGIHAFTLGIKNGQPGQDEVLQASATAKMHDMKHIIHSVEPHQTLKSLDDWIAGYEEPFYHVAVTSVMSEAVAAQGLKVVLSGLGGDELFGGYRHFRWCSQIPTHRRLGSLLKWADQIPHQQFRKAIGYLTAGTSDRAASYARMTSPDSLLRKLFVAEWHPKVSTVDYLHNMYAAELTFAHPIEALSYMELINYVGNHHLHRMDQFTMAHSIEGRVPYLDHELVDYSFRVPAHLKVKGQVGKYILRTLATRHIDPSCLSQSKKGFGLPLGDWMRGPLKHMISEALSGLKKRPMIQSATVDAWSKGFEAGKINGDQMWHLVALELWFRRFID